MASTSATSVPRESRRGLSARIVLGRVFAPVPSEFVLIASTALLLTGFGLTMVLSATTATSTAAGQDPYVALLKQAIFAAIGVPLMFLASRMPVLFWKRIAWPALIFAILFQLTVFTPLGISADGNRSWIYIFGLQAQPAEFLKLALAIWLGAVLARKQPLLHQARHAFIPAVPVTLIVVAAVMAGQDLGTTMILGLVFTASLFFSGVRLRLFIVPVAVGLAAVAVLVVTSPDRMRRIMSFAGSNSDCLAQYYGNCYQTLHGIWGLASGGVLGLGLGNSKQKYDWLPAAANDYIFAIVGEELGLIGCVVALALFTLFAVGAFHVIRKTNDPFVRIVAGGITIWIVGEALINIAVVLKLFPVMGVPLPFMSQGGTSLVAVLVGCGILLSFARSLPGKNASPAGTLAR
ncbi:MAG TPA: putative lipid II flippase FtsW [Microbacterium sp.]|nr:putative lipid II flippase FtsW [Microbacterium sp.]